MGSEGSKSPKNGVYTVLAKILSTEIYMVFLLPCKGTNGLLVFAIKQHVWEKSRSWVLVLKPQGQSECKIP